MLEREIQRRTRHFTRAIKRRLRLMSLASQRPLSFLGVMLEGPEIQLTLTILLVTILSGTLGYILLEGYQPFNAFYMTVITLTTVGYGEIEPLTTLGRVFSVLLIFSGVTLVTYGASSVMEYMVTGKAVQTLSERERETLLKGLSQHFIIVGFGRVGREIALNFTRERIPFVVIESSAEMLKQAQEVGYLALQGSGAEDDILLEAGIKRARGVVAAAGDDATNVYVVLTARGLNEKVLIIARAIDENSESKLIRAGANHVTSPYVLSGQRMANLALRPHVVDFLDFTSRSHDFQQSLEEVIVESGAIVANKTIGQIDLRRRAGANILAIYDPNGQLISNPTANTMIEPGTRLIILGTRDQLAVTEALSRNITHLAQDT